LKEKLSAVSYQRAARWSFFGCPLTAESLIQQAISHQLSATQKRDRRQAAR
jgi:hypothetical protein